MTIYQRNELDKFRKADPCADSHKIAEIADCLGVPVRQAHRFLSKKRSFDSQKIIKRNNTPSKSEIEKMKAGLELMLAKKRNIRTNYKAVSFLHFRESNNQIPFQAIFILKSLKKKYRSYQVPIDKEVDSICYSNVLEISSTDPASEDLSSFKLLDEESWSRVDFDNAEFAANLSAIQVEEISDDEEHFSFNLLSDEECRFDLLDEPFCHSFYSDHQLYFVY